MKIYRLRLYLALVVTMCIATALQAFDNSHFYRAPYFYGETRLECPWLCSLEFSLAGGSSSTGFNSTRKKVPLLDIYGPSAMQALGKNVPKDSSNPLDLILIMLEQLPARSTFGQLSFDGNFDITEGMFLWTQNFKHGFFAQAVLPLRKLSIHNVSYTDLSPDDTLCPNKNSPQWQAFLAQFDNILARYALDIRGTKRSGVGDLTILGGWTINYNETDWLDFVDITIRGGVLFPTGKKTDPSIVFDLPLGYNGHTALTGSTLFAFGLYEWLTIGTYADLLIFMGAHNKIRIKTAAEQSGFIKLVAADASIKPGLLSDVGCYIKADHFCRGLSLIFGYEYAQKCDDKLTLCPPSTCYNLNIVNSDEAFKGWNQQAVQFVLECDFTQEDTCFGGKLSLFYNRTITGKRIFRTNMGGALVGFDIAYAF